jgi:hypothetical protein
VCSKALGGGPIDIKALDNRVLRVPLKEVVRPGYERVVVGEGAVAACEGGAVRASQA